MRLAAVRRLRPGRCRPAGLATLALLGLVVLAACGRPLPDDQAENAPPGGDTTGAFDVGGGEASDSLKAAGDAELAKLVQAAGRAFETQEDVGVAFAEQPGEEAYAALCAGRVDVAATIDRAHTVMLGQLTQELAGRRPKLRGGRRPIGAFRARCGPGA